MTVGPVRPSGCGGTAQDAEELSRMTYEVAVEQRPEQAAAVVQGVVSHDELSAFLAAAFGEVGVVLAQQGIFPSGPPLARYRLEPGGFDVEAGFPVPRPVMPTGRVQPTTLPGGEVAETVHVGPYEGIAAAYTAVAAWLETDGRHPTGAPWELYLDDPDVAEPRTVVCFPCSAASAD